MGAESVPLPPGTGLLRGVPGLPQAAARRTQALPRADSHAGREVTSKQKSLFLKADISSQEEQLYAEPGGAFPIYQSRVWVINALSPLSLNRAFCSAEIRGKALNSGEGNEK